MDEQIRAELLAEAESYTKDPHIAGLLADRTLAAVQEKLSGRELSANDMVFYKAQLFLTFATYRRVSKGEPEELTGQQTETAAPIPPVMPTEPQPIPLAYAPIPAAAAQQPVPPAPAATEVQTTPVYRPVSPVQAVQPAPIYQPELPMSAATAAQPVSPVQAAQPTQSYQPVPPIQAAQPAPVYQPEPPAPAATAAQPVPPVQAAQPAPIYQPVPPVQSAQPAPVYQPVPPVQSAQPAPANQSVSSVPTESTPHSSDPMLAQIEASTAYDPVKTTLWMPPAADEEKKLHRVDRPFDPSMHVEEEEPEYRSVRHSMINSFLVVGTLIAFGFALYESGLLDPLFR